MDLWAHFSEEQHTQNNNEAAPQNGSRRASRRSRERLQLELIRNWLLQDYVTAYCRSLAATHIFRRCYWIDALGLDNHALVNIPVAETSSNNGRGRKKAVVAIPRALQPLMALSQELATEAKPIALYSLLFAAGSSRRGMVRPTIDTIDPTIIVPKESGVISASWLEAAPPVLKTLEQVPAIFLLNPLSAPLFQTDDLAPLMARAVPTELCLLLPHKQIIAYLSAAQSQGIQTTSLNGLLRTDRWKTLSIKAEEQSQTIERFIELFISALQRHFSFPIQPVHIPVSTAPASVESIPFTLLFATRRQDSLYTMNDAINRYRWHIETESYRGILSESWFIDQQQVRHAEEVQKLTERVIEQGRLQRMRRWPDLRQQLLLTQFGQFQLHDYDTIVQQLLLKEEITCSWRKSAVDGEEQRIPGNDDLLTWR